MSRNAITVGDLSAFIMYSAYVGTSIGGTNVNTMKIIFVFGMNN